jgi:SPP1 family predicted phage head-tail adaptor
MITVSVGALRNRIEIEKNAPTTDLAGGRVDVWEHFVPVWARIETLSGKRLVAAQALAAEVTHEILVRYRPALANPVDAVKNYRIKWGSRIFNLHGVNNVEERNVWMLLQCSEGVVRV